MICDCCMRIFELNDLNHFERSGEPVPHHVNTQSFVLSATAGCPICRAILSELHEPQELLSDPNTVSFTECFVEMDSHVPSYHLNFTWNSPGVPLRSRLLLVEPYHLVRPFLPHIPLEARRGWADQTLNMVKTWIHNCFERHPKCRVLHAWRTSGSGFQPRRLVDVGATDGTTWRLVLREGNAIFPATYATVSHRWSPDQQFKLIDKNVEAYTNAQPLHLLPQVFQDAIKVIKSLGIRYLWADCLCIIQDSLSDWEVESLEMCKIYTNSICNISITGFEDNSTGFLGKTCGYLPLPCKVQPRWAGKIDGGWCVLDPFFWWAQVTKAPLTKRGWVFQERFLAPRVVHFGPEQLLWECASLDACEAFPQGLPAAVESPRHTGFKKLDFLLENPADKGFISENNYLVSMTAEDLLYHWCTIVQAYTRTSLTKPNDKLIALAGVAQLMSRSNNYVEVASSEGYLAGLFKQHLLLMLEWHSDGNISSRPEPAGVRPPHYRAPSWSWASIDGRVFYDYLPRNIDDDLLWARLPSWQVLIEHLNEHMSTEDASPWPIASKCLHWKSLILDVEASVTNAGGSRFGQVLNADLVLTGVLMLAQDIIMTSFSNLFLRPVLLYLDTPTTPGQIQTDTLLLPLRCIQLRSSDNDDPYYWVTALLLEPVDPGESTYKRCGMLSVISTDGVRELGIELTENPFNAKYSDDTKLETIRII